MTLLHTKGVSVIWKTSTTLTLLPVVVSSSVFRLVTRHETADAVVRHSVAPRLPEQPLPLLYALSLENEALSTAHEREMAAYRDMLQQTRQPDQEHAGAASLERLLQPEALWDDVTPAETVREACYATAATASPHQADKHNQLNSRNSSSVTDRGSRRPLPKKAVTAASFFGNQPPGNTRSARTATATPPASRTLVSTTKPVKSAAKPNVAALDEKENNRDDLVGNADDFVGDLDDNDDDSVPGDAAPAVPAEHVPRRPSKRVLIPDSSDDEADTPEESAATGKTTHETLLVDAAPPVKGAMDDFAQKAAPLPGNLPSRRRRRKVTKEKTTVDPNGFLHTEIQEVWEDIPSDEEETQLVGSPIAKAAPPAKKTSTVKAGMKQKSLANFFQKK